MKLTGPIVCLSALFCQNVYAMPKNLNLSVGGPVAPTGSTSTWPSPQIGEMIYQSSDDSFYGYNGTSWINFRGQSPLQAEGAGTPIAAGYVGNKVEASFSDVALTNNTNANAGSISLPAGNWMVYYKPCLELLSVSTFSVAEASISTASATTHDPSAIRDTSTNVNVDHFFGTPVRYLNLTSTTTVYAVILGVFSGGTLTSKASCSQFFAVQLN